MQEFLGIPKFIIKEDFEKNPENGFYCLRPTVVVNSQLYKLPLQCLTDLGNNKGRTRSKKSHVVKNETITELLRIFYKPFNEKLQTILGRKLSWS